MKIALLLLVFGIYTSVIGLESKNEDSEKKDELDSNLVSRLGFRVEIKKPSNEEIIKKINKIFDDKNIKNVYCLCNQA